MDKVTLSIDLVNAMLGCLGKMPFIEVQGIINAVQLEANAQFTQDVSTDSIDALITDSVAAISTDSVEAISTENVDALTTDSVAALSTDQAAALSTEQV